MGVGTGENINEGPLGFSFPGYRERIERMGEALEIMYRLFAGEKVDFEGQYYTLDKARLYSPPTRPVPILMAGGRAEVSDIRRIVSRWRDHKCQESRRNPGASNRTVCHRLESRLTKRNGVSNALDRLCPTP